MKKLGLKQYEGDLPYIFVSYSHKDKDLVFPILKELQKAGFRIWFDEGIEWGSEWPEAIQQHLIDSAVFVAFLSNNFANSKNCRQELGLAQNKNKEMLAIFLEEVDLNSAPGGLELQLTLIQQTFPFQYKEMEKFYERLFKNSVLQVTKDNETNNKTEMVKESSNFPQDSEKQFLNEILDEQLLLTPQAQALLSLLQDPEQLNNLFSLLSHQNELIKSTPENELQQIQNEELSLEVQLSDIEDDGTLTEDNNTTDSIEEKIGLEISKEDVKVIEATLESEDLEIITEIIEFEEKNESNLKVTEEDLISEVELIETAPELKDSVIKENSTFQKILLEPNTTGLEEICEFYAPLTGKYEIENNELMIIPNSVEFYSPIKETGTIFWNEVSSNTQNIRIFYSNQIYVDIKVELKSNLYEGLTINKKLYQLQPHNRFLIEEIYFKEPLFKINLQEISKLFISVNYASPFIKLFPIEIGDISSQEIIGKVYLERPDSDVPLNLSQTFEPPIHGKVKRGGLTLYKNHLKSPFPFVQHYLDTGTYLEIVDQRFLRSPVDGIIHLIPPDRLSREESQSHYLSFSYEFNGGTSEVLVYFEFDDLISYDEFVRFLNLRVKNGDKVSAGDLIGYLDPKKLGRNMKSLNPKISLLFPYDYPNFEFFVSVPFDSILNDIHSEYIKLKSFNSLSDYAEELFSGIFNPISSEKNLNYVKIQNQTILTPVTGKYNLIKGINNKWIFQISECSKNFYSPSNTIVENFSIKNWTYDKIIDIKLKDLTFPLTYSIKINLDRLSLDNDFVPLQKGEVLKKTQLLVELSEYCDINQVEFEITYDGIYLKGTVLSDGWVENKCGLIRIELAQIPETLIETHIIESPVQGKLYIDNECFSNFIIPQRLLEESNQKIVKNTNTWSFSVDPDKQLRKIIMPSNGILEKIHYNKNNKTIFIILRLGELLNVNNKYYLPEYSASVIFLISSKFVGNDEEIQSFLKKYSKKREFFQQGKTLLELSQGSLCDFKFSISDSSLSWRHLYQVSNKRLILSTSDNFFKSKEFKLGSEDCLIEEIEDKELEKNLTKNNGFLVLENDLNKIPKRKSQKLYLVRGIIIPETNTRVESEAFKNIFALDVYFFNSNIEIEDNAFSILPQTTIHGFKGSAAEEFAQRNGLKFESFNGSNISNNAEDYQTIVANITKEEVRKINSIEIPGIEILTENFFDYLRKPDSNGHFKVLFISELIINGETLLTKNVFISKNIYVSNLVLKGDLDQKRNLLDSFKDDPINQDLYDLNYYKEKFEEQTERRKSNNVCQHCGGSFTIFTKKCKVCGRKKDY